MSSSPCCNGNCGCGADCKCDTSCSGGRCKKDSDLGYTGERSTGETVVSGSGPPEKAHFEGSEMGAGAETGGCKCNPCTCNPCTCTGETVVSGTGPEKAHFEGSEMGAGAETGGCKCNPCTCNPCTCK